jgi:hypothetical protein
MVEAQHSDYATERVVVVDLLLRTCERHDASMRKGKAIPPRTMDKITKAIIGTCSRELMMRALATIISSRPTDRSEIIDLSSLAAS